MYAFISDEYQCVLHDKQKIQVLKKIYTRPVVKMFATARECEEYILSHPRKMYLNKGQRSGWSPKAAYMRVECFVDVDTIYANVYTDHFGYVYPNIKKPNVIYSATYDLIKIKMTGVHVKPGSITSQCLAIYNIVSLFNDIINMQVVVPDISVYLALTAYSGRNPAINRIRDGLNGRIGKVALILKN